jgi:hypothetical protein
MGEGGKGFLFLGDSFQILSVRFLCDFCANFCANFCVLFVCFLCEFLCAFCANFCVLFVRIFVWVHKGNAYGVRRPFAGATFWGDIYGIFNYFVGIGVSTRSGREVKYFVRGRRAECQKRMLYGGATLSKKLAIFLPILFQTSEILQVLFYKIEILFLAYRRWGIKHLQVT